QFRIQAACVLCSFAALVARARCVAAGPIGPLAFFNLLAATPAAPVYTATDLGTLAGGTASEAYLINAQGDILGQSLTGKIDTQGNPVVHDVLWSKGSMIDLTNLLPNPSAWQVDDYVAAAVNNRGQVVLADLYGGKGRVFFFSPGG